VEGYQEQPKLSIGGSNTDFQFQRAAPPILNANESWLLAVHLLRMAFLYHQSIVYLDVSN